RGAVRPVVRTVGPVEAFEKIDLGRPEGRAGGGPTTDRPEGGPRAAAVGQQKLRGIDAAPMTPLVEHLAGEHGRLMRKHAAVAEIDRRVERAGVQPHVGPAGGVRLQRVNAFAGLVLLGPWQVGASLAVARLRVAVRGTRAPRRASVLVAG